MNAYEGIRIWAAQTSKLARIWVCNYCGAKVFCGRLSVKPEYRCLCGKASWHRQEKRSG